MTKKKSQGFVYSIWVLLAGACFLAFARGNFSVVFICLMTFALSSVPFFLQKKYQLYIPQGFINGIVFFVYATLFLGEVGDFYERFWWWDAILHTGSAVGFSLIAFIGLALWVGEERMRSNALMMSIFACCAAIAIGAVWEIFEFSMDQFFGMNMQKSGLIDTMWDLIVDSCGALIAAVAGYFYVKDGVQGSMTRLIDDAIKNNTSQQ